MPPTILWYSYIHFFHLWQSGALHRGPSIRFQNSSQSFWVRTQALSASIHLHHLPPSWRNKSPTHPQSRATKPQQYRRNYHSTTFSEKNSKELESGSALSRIFSTLPRLLNSQTINSYYSSAHPLHQQHRRQTQGEEQRSPQTHIL